MTTEVTKVVAVEDLAPLDLRGVPTGPPRYVPSLDLTVPTYLEPNVGYRNCPTLDYHVPMEFRGPYKDENGDKAKCTQILVHSDADCKQRAMNHSGFCQNHGGALHPLDKKKEEDWSKASRAKRFRYGKLPIEELDDEELARGMVRNEDGTWAKIGTIPKEMHDHIVRELFMRADNALSSNLLKAVETMAEIAGGSAYEPADRINAAKWIYERVRGKVPDKVEHSQAEPWQVVYQGIQGGSRAESRAARGIVDAEDDVVDADWLDEEYAGPPIPEPVEEEPYEPPPSYEVPQPEQPVGPVGKPIDVSIPPLDPQQRDNYEADREEERKRAEEAKKHFREQMRAAKARRYAAQSQGRTSVEVVSYDMQFKDNGDGTETVRFIAPEDMKVPASVKAKDTRARNKTRRDQ